MERRLRLGSVIEFNQTHPKSLPIEHNRTYLVIEHCMQQSNIKPVSSGFKQKALRSNKLCIGFNFKHEYAKMSQNGKREKFRKRWLKATTSASFRRQCRWQVYSLEEKGRSSSEGNWLWPRPTWTNTTWTGTCTCMFPSIDFESLKQ